MTVCAAAGCTNPLPATRRTGRPALYCTPACRPSHKRGRGPRPAGLTIELVDTNQDTSPPSRNPHPWAVRLRRGPHTVTVADHLGRFTATALANDLQHLIHPQGAATD